jgi:hypothetical protein
VGATGFRFQGVRRRSATAAAGRSSVCGVTRLFSRLGVGTDEAVVGGMTTGLRGGARVPSTATGCELLASRRTSSSIIGLVRYCEDGDLEIDNNGGERSLRGVAAGGKNWMFFGSDNGGRRATVRTSLIATCQRHRIDPFAYLRDVFERIDAHPA